MPTPLHCDAYAIIEKRDRLIAPGAHPGLVFERFFSGYEHDWSVTTDKSAWFRDFFTADGRASRAVGDKKAIEAACARLVALAQSLGGSGDVFALDWYFATGLGNAHPLENGFHWHPTLGTPFVSGSSIKGFVRAWIKEWTDIDRETQLRWFGPERKEGGEENEDSCAGELIFFDAIPVEPPRVGPDVMTPHMGGWYEKGASVSETSNEVPADWHAPNPVPFLVTKEARFVFCVAPRVSSAKDDIPQILQHLNDALSMLGLGAKTATGYGHMHQETRKEVRYERWLQNAQAKLTESKQQKERAQQQREEAKRARDEESRLSERLKAAIEMLKEWSKNVADQGKLIRDTGEVAERAMSEDWSPEEKQYLYEAIMKTPYAKINNPAKKKERMAKLNPLVSK